METRKESKQTLIVKTLRFLNLIFTAGVDLETVSMAIYKVQCILECLFQNARVYSCVAWPVDRAVGEVYRMVWVDGNFTLKTKNSDEYDLKYKSVAEQTLLINNPIKAFTLLSRKQNIQWTFPFHHLLIIS